MNTGTKVALGAAIGGLAIGVPIAVAITARPASGVTATPAAAPTVGLSDAPSETPTPPPTPSPSPVAVATDEPQPVRTVVVVSQVPAPARQPQGTLQMQFVGNTVGNTDTCAQAKLRFSNRSDTAINTVTINFNGIPDKGSEFPIGTRTFSLGLPAFDEREYVLQVCDSRLHGNQYGADVDPVRYRWTWF